MTIMKAAYHSGEKEIIMREVNIPAPGPGEYLVKIKACSICGSDTWWLNDASDGEPVHGHESAGVIEACGEGCAKFKVGDRVVCYAILGCGDCAYCIEGNPTNCQNKNFIEGGFQEYSVFNEKLLFACPDDVDFITASLLSDAIGVPLRGLRRLIPDVDDKVCVWGLGPLGLLQVMFLKAHGVKNIIGLDTVEERLQKARELGADYTVNPLSEDSVAVIKELCGGLGADKAYTYVRNAKATEDIFKSTREGASICTFVGLDGHYELQEYYERTLVWSFYFTPAEYEENLKFIKDRQIDLKKIVSDLFPLDKINEAFKKRFENPEESLKIVITMD
jgi:threonine dehydrogenase-like Zn-dependent dehydrogenase